MIHFRPHFDLATAQSTAGSRRRGMVFVIALGIIVVLTGLVLVFAQSMRTDALASANRRSDAEADAVELGAEQWVEAQVDAYQPDAMTITQVPAEAIQVGSGYFWILQYDPDSDQDQLFGITDELSKLNINKAAAAQLMTLPCDLQQNVADAITDWRNPVNQATADGAESSYYESLTEPYQCKNELYESVEELLLVEGVTPQLLWGYDLNRDGVLEDAERAAGGSNVGSFTGAGGGTDGRGIYNYLTCYGNGAVNVNTASDVVLTALGMSPGNAQALVSQRQGQDYTNTNWASSLLNGSGIRANQITGQSSFYSADIVAVSGDGRAFRRVRIVVSLPKQAPPSTIVYRKDLTSFGWPLPQSIRDALRSGRGIQTGTMQSSLTSSGTVGQNH
ncbi:MAG TPA: type II secretion system protein GspK [Tepidisphaeraceae bacterium]|jgi:type II secretory pathway component PulK|nr:type II secretion system protein GspK [Tepidisphaeraceae bacterium]